MINSNRSIATLDFNRRPSGYPLIKKTENMSVMIVDDEKPFLELISLVLAHNYGFEITKANNAFEALSSMESNCFKLIITDYQMPGMDGLILASTIKKRNPSAVIILMTGLKFEILKSKKGLENIDLYIEKPFKMKTLINIVKKIISAG